MPDHKLRLESLRHRDQHCIAIKGHLVPMAGRVVRNFPGRLFSKTYSCWYVPYSRETLERLQFALSAQQPVEVVGDFGESLIVCLPDGYHEKLLRWELVP